MSSLNQCIFIGNLGADPEIRTMGSGDKVANFRIACSEKWKDKNTGEKREKTEWVNVSIFGPLVGIVESYLKKGSKVFVSGKMQTRKYQAHDGTDRYSTEIVLQGFGGQLIMLDSAGGQSGGAATHSTTGNSVGSGSPPDLDDDIPF